MNDAQRLQEYFSLHWVEIGEHIQISDLLDLHSRGYSSLIDAILDQIPLMFNPYFLLGRRNWLTQVPELLENSKKAWEVFLSTYKEENGYLTVVKHLNDGCYVACYAPCESFTIAFIRQWKEAGIPFHETLRELLRENLLEKGWEDLFEALPDSTQNDPYSLGKLNQSD